MVTNIKPLDNDALLFILEFLREKYVDQNDEIEHANYTQLSRVGYSGVNIYIVNFTSTLNRSIKKIVFKIASKKGDPGLLKKLKNESENYKKYVKYTLDNAPTGIESYDSTEFGGIAYPYKSEGTTLNLHELFLIAFKEESEQPVEGGRVKTYDDISVIISKIYKNTLKKWMSADYQVLGRKWGKQYDWYLRWEKSRPRIRGILNCKNEDQEFVYYNDRKYHNPINIINLIRNEEHDFLTRIVHGDLHQRNILVNGDDREERPWVIDFEWTDSNKHFLIDYALLECSIKFQYLTPLMIDNEIFTFEKCLNNRVKVENAPFKYSRIKHLYSQIRSIRELAFDEYRTALKKQGRSVSSIAFQGEYLQAVILMTAGLLGVSNFEEIDKRGLVSSLIFLCNEHGSRTEKAKKLNDIGENDIVKKYIFKAFKNENFPQIILDKGDDCSAFTLSGKSNVVVASTDPCPLPVAWLLGDLDYYIYGWYSVLINLSDLASMGAKPIGMQLSLEMPEDMHISDFEDFLRGVKDISSMYNCPIIGGNVKDGSRFISTGTIFGEGQKYHLLLRDKAQVNDKIVVIGSMGLFWSAVLEYNNPELFTPDELKQIINAPLPRTVESQTLVQHGLTECGMDSSDGLISCFHEIAQQSSVNFCLDYSLVESSLDPRVIKAATKHGIAAVINLAFTWGDWQLVTCISESNFASFEEIFKDIPYHVVGTVKDGPAAVTLKKENGDFNIKDFGSKRFSETSYFSNGLDAYKSYLSQDFLIPIING